MDCCPRQSAFFCLACLILMLSSPALAQEGLNLQQAFDLALEHNEQIQISRENLQQARGDVDVATSSLWPQLTAQGRHVRQKEFDSLAPTPEKYNLFSLRLNQHLYQMGKVWSGRRLAKHYYQGSRHGHLRQSQEILFQVGMLYYEVLLAARSIEIAQDFLTRAQQQLQRAQALLDAGMTTQTDVLRARVLVAQAQEQLVQAQNNHDIAREDLALEIGLEALPAGPLQPYSPQMPDHDLQELYQISLKHRQDLAKAKEDLQAKQEGVDFERADFFPRLSLEGQYSRTDEEQLFYGDENEDWQASLQVSYPLFTGGKRRAELQQARSRQSQAQIALRRLEKEIRNQVRSIRLQIQTREQIVQHLKEEVQAARSNYQQVLAQYEQGLASSVDLVDAQTAYSESQSRLAQARYGLDLDLLRLKFTLGTLNKEQLQKEEFTH